MSLGEFELIADFFLRQSDNPDLLVPNGDDAAVVATRGNMAISIDTLVAGAHFPEDANAGLIARRALRVNLSDMAAMGARPRWFTLTLTLPGVDSTWLADFSAGLFADAEQFGCQLIGGDTTRGPLNIGIQILGEIPAGQQPLTRSGARAGDLLVVTGTLGDAAAALELDLNQSPDENHLIKRYWLPDPRVDFALGCRPQLHAALDISDGLVADASHLCQQSGLSARIQLDSVPISEALRQHWGDGARRRALSGGDDYELCMAVAPTDWAALQKYAALAGVPVTAVGQFELPGDSCVAQVVDAQGKPLNMPAVGYRHF